MSNDIGNIILDAFKNSTGKNTNKSEINSWMNSLQYMDRILDDGIPHDAGVSIEYHLPQTSKRIDFILTGRDHTHRETVILVELKQWQTAQITDSDAMVMTQFKHGYRETLHPSYQAWTYKRLLADFNTTIQENNIQLYPCAYLHNYDDDDVITHEFYAEHIRKAPVFLKKDALKLREFIKANVKYGDNSQIMYRIDHGKIKPSRSLSDQLLSMIKGNEEFVLIDDQKIAFEVARRLTNQSSEIKKNVLIVEGGPGTGKSVVAINLLVSLTDEGFVSQYVTRNSAPRQVYEAKLTGSVKKTHISNLFTSSGSYHSVEPNIFDCLIVDEAHRLNEKSGIFSNLGENQIKEIINASKLAVFFIDEDQKVTIKDVGDKNEIRKWADILNAKVTELTLESQFRCNGSDGYLSWLDNTLQIRETVHTHHDPVEFDFRIMSCPKDMHDQILELNKERNKARVVAGYCWDWISKKKPVLKDIVIGDYKATWNLGSDGQAWIIKDDSASEIGCIHTCQGLEVDYIGVIVGPDLIVRNGIVETRPEERSKMDRSIFGWKSLSKSDPVSTSKTLDRLIKNTYRTLMSRGQKGCFVYFVDDETREYFENRVKKSHPEIPIPKSESLKKEAASTPPFRILSPDEISQYINCVPLYNLKAAAGLFSDEQDIQNTSWIELPDTFRIQPGLFVAQVLGESMNRRVPNGSWCLFRMNPTGTRQGKIVLVEYREISDADTGGHYTLKIYDSKKDHGPDDSWSHKSIILKPDSTMTCFEPIILKHDQADNIKIIAELVAVLN